MTERPTELELQFGKDLVRGARALHDLESKRSGQEVIDFRLAPREWVYEPNYFPNRTEARKYFKRISDDVLRDTPDGEYIGEKADGFLAELEFLADPSLDQFEERMRRMAGYYPRLIPRHEVEGAKEDVANIFRERYGLKFDRAGWTNFFNQNRLSPSQFKREIQMSEREIITQLVRVVGSRSHPRIRMQEVDLPEYWVGWISANQDEVEFKYNINTINSERLYRGAPIRVGLHEGGAHGIHAQSFLDNAREGSVNPGRVETTVPGVENWLMEAWASRVSKVHPSVLSHLPAEARNATELSVDLQYLTDIALTNAQYELLVSRRKRELVTADLQNLLPHEPKGRIELVLDKMTNLSRPDRMFYLPVYGDGSYFFRKEIEPLSEVQKQAFTAEIHRQPMTPKQVKEFVTRLTSSNHRSNLMAS